jgi:hypothetical protein
MGNTWKSSSQDNHFVDIPDTEYTTCAILIKKLGYRMVVFGFTDIIPILSDELCLPLYTKEAQITQIQKLSQKMSETVSAFLLALLTQGITIVITTDLPQDQNGNVKEIMEKKCGYIFQGQPLIQGVLQDHFGDDLAKFMHVEEGKTMWSAIKSVSNKYRMTASEILVIHQNVDLIRKARERRMGGILVEDHMIGFRLQ